MLLGLIVAGEVVVVQHVNVVVTVVVRVVMVVVEIVVVGHDQYRPHTLMCSSSSWSSRARLLSAVLIRGTPFHPAMDLLGHVQPRSRHSALRLAVLAR